MTVDRAIVCSTETELGRVILFPSARRHRPTGRSMLANAVASMAGWTCRMKEVAQTHNVKVLKYIVLTNFIFMIYNYQLRTSFERLGIYKKQMCAVAHGQPSKRKARVSHVSMKARVGLYTELCDSPMLAFLQLWFEISESSN
jgi:hypothetical protein